MRTYNLQKLGEAIIIQAVSVSYIVIARTPTYAHPKFIKEQEGCLNFVCGSGLDNTIKYFGLDLNSEKIRQMFWEKVE